MEELNHAYGTNPNPQTVNLVHVIYDDEFVALINSLSSCIKDYYKSSRQTIGDLFSSLEGISSQTTYSKMTIEDMFKSKSFDKLNQLHESLKSLSKITDPCNSNIESIELNLNTFFTEAKVLFKKMKVTRSKKLEESMGKDTKMNNYFSNRRAVGYSPKVSEETISVRKPSYSPQINKIRTTRGNVATNILSSTNYNSKPKHMQMTGMSNDEMRISHSNLEESLAKNIISFLNQMQILQESILKRTIDVQERKKTFEMLKQDIKKQAEIALLHSHSKRVLTPNKIKINTGFNSPKVNKENDIIFMKMIDDLKQAKNINERNESLISQLKSEMQKLICDNDKLIQENNAVKTDYNNLLLLKEKTMIKSKNIQSETIQVLQQEIKTLNDELINKSKRLENTKKLEFEINKLKNEIQLAHEENFEQEIKAMKDENYKLFEDLKKFKIKAVEGDLLKTEVTKLYKIIRDHEENISNKENVILTLTENNSLQLAKIQKLQEMSKDKEKNMNKEMKKIEKKLLSPIQLSLCQCQENDLMIISQENISKPLKAIPVVVNPKDIENHIKAQYDQEIVVLKKYNDQLKKDRLDSNDELQRIIRDIKEKDFMNSQLNDKVIQFDNLVTQLTKDKDSLNNEILSLKGDNKLLKANIEEKMKDILMIQQSLHLKESVNKEEYDEMMILKTTNEKLSHNIKQKDLSILSLTKAEQEKSNELLKSNIELEKYYKLLEESINEINGYKDQCENFKQDIIKYEEKIKGLNDEIIKHKKQIDNLTQDIVTHKNKAEKATSSLDQIAKDKTIQQEQIASKFNEEKDKLTKELTNEINQKITIITSLNETISQYKTKEKDYNDIIEKLSNEITLLKKDMTKLLTDKEIIENALLIKDKEIVQLTEEKNNQQQSSQSQLKSLINQIDKQKTEIASAQKIHNSTIQTLSEVNSNLHTIRIENNQLKEAITNSSDQNTQTISHLNEELSSKQQQITKLQNTINSLQSNVSDSFNEIVNYQKIIQSKEDDIAKLTNEKTELKQELTKQNELQKNKEKERNNLIKEVNEYKETMSKDGCVREELSTKLDILTIELTKAKTAKDNTIKEYEKQIKEQTDNHNKKIEDLTEKIDHLTQDHRILDQNYKILEGKEKEYLNTISSFKTQHQSLQEQHHILNTSSESNIKLKDNIIDSLNEQIKKHQNSFTTLNNQKKTYQEEILSLNSELTKVQIERSNQKSLYEQKEESNTNLKKQVTHLSNELSGTKEELEDKMTIITSLKSMIKSNDSKNDKEINDLIANNEKLREEIKSMNTKNEELKTSLGDTEKANLLLKESNQRLEKNTKEIEGLNNNKDKDIKMLKEMHDVIVKEKSLIEKDNEQFQVETLNMTKIIEQNKSELMQIKALLKDKENMIIEQDKTIKQKQKDYNDSNETKAKEILLLSQKNEQLQIQFNTIDKELIQCKTNSEQLSNKLTSKDNEINLLKGTIDELSGKIDSKDNELSKTKELLSRVNSLNNKNSEDTRLVIQDITTKLQKANEEIESHSNEIKRLKQELASLDKIHNEKITIINQLNETISLLKKDHSKATDETTKCKAMIQTYVNLITTNDNESKSALETVNTELNRVKSLLNDKETELNKREEFIKEKDNELNKIKESLTKAEEALIKNKEAGNQKISQLASSCDDNKNEIKIVKDALKEKKAQLNVMSESNLALENEIKANKETIQLLKEENQKGLDEMKAYFELLTKEKDTNQALQIQLNTSKTSIVKLTQENNQLNECKEIIKEELNRLMKKDDSLLETITNLTEDNKNINALLTKAREENNQLNECKEIIKEELDRLMKKDDSRLETITNLTEDNKNMNALLAKAKEENNQLNDEIKSLKKTIDESLINESGINNQLTQLKTSNEDLQQKVSQGELQIKDLTEKLSDSTNQAKSFEHLNSELNNNYNEVLETLNRLKAKHKELIVHNTSLESKLAESGTEMSKMVQLKEKESSSLNQLQLAESKVNELKALLKIEEERNNEMVNKFVQEKDAHYHQVTDLEEENHALQFKIDEQTKQIQELMNTSKVIDKKYHEVQSKNKKDNDILETLTIELNQQKVLVNDKDKELKQAQTSIANYTEQLTTINGQVNKQNLKIEALTQEKKDSNELISQLKQENATLLKEKEESNDVSSKNTGLLKEKELYILQIKNKEKMLFDTNAQLGLLKQQVKDNSVTIESQKQQINVYTIEKEEILKQVALLLEEINTKNKEIVSLKGNLQESEEDKKTETLIIQEEYQKTKKENEALQIQISKLTDQLVVLSNDLNKQVNVINLKEKEIQSYRNSGISNKSIGTMNSPTFCQAQNTNLSGISPATHIILHNKNYKSFTWYLLTLKTLQGQPSYKDFIWVSNETIQANSYNTFKREEEEELEYNLQLQNKCKNLEQKVDIISKQNYEIKQLKEQLHHSANFNNSANKDAKTKYSEMKLLSKENINSTSPNFPISMDKYNELLQQINNKDLAIAQLQKEVKDGREKRALEANCSGIQEKNSSGFLDDIGFDNVITQFDEKKKPFSSTNKNDNDERNDHLQDQLNFLKSEIKNLNTKQSEMNDHVISLIKNSQINPKTKPFIISIGKTLGYTEESWMKFINAFSEDKEKKKGVLGFFGGGKK